MCVFLSNIRGRAALCLVCDRADARRTEVPDLFHTAGLSSRSADVQNITSRMTRRAPNTHINEGEETGFGLQPIMQAEGFFNTNLI